MSKLITEENKIKMFDDPRMGYWAANVLADKLDFSTFSLDSLIQQIKIFHPEYVDSDDDQRVIKIQKNGHHILYLNNNDMQSEKYKIFKLGEALIFYYVLAKPDSLIKLISGTPLSDIQIHEDIEYTRNEIKYFTSISLEVIKAAKHFIIPDKIYSNIYRKNFGNHHKISHFFQCTIEQSKQKALFLGL